MDEEDWIVAKALLETSRQSMVHAEVQLCEAILEDPDYLYIPHFRVNGADFDNGPDSEWMDQHNEEFDLFERLKIQFYAEVCRWIDANGREVAA